MTLSLAAARDALSRGLFADTARPEKPPAHFGLDMLSDWLPYRVYDEGAKLSNGPARSSASSSPKACRRAPASRS